MNEKKQQNSDVASKQANYYGGLLEKCGTGVDAVASGKQIYKDLRYEKLGALIELDESCSVYDVGFGLGHFYEFLKARYPKKDIQYSGSEITPAFVEYCLKTYPECDFHLYDLANAPLPDRYDYLIFGGTFYHLAGTSTIEFGDYVRSLLTNGFLSAERGIAFNLITEYVDYRYDDLFYGKLSEIIDFVAKDLSRFFMIDHASPLFEYTVRVYREDYIASHYPAEEFKKYFKVKE